MPDGKIMRCETVMIIILNTTVFRETTGKTRWFESIVLIIKTAFRV